ncbi:hypothetical protein LEP1GSC116_1255 [Leptospira interrogans serovar Icterohaemorrhagiae str. Verdun HP]|uniref:Uncharacterized protein n=5 Tax=Leptospira interrogans TaxID=173 RepID=M3I1U8_LEPIR|nr:hypothetical protein LEP1GSC151_4513 [Leptospira interrogans serovar Grippotyphosa str. LT2186]EMG22736.1 hypothetical protein LEP1GSC150_4838 [Leptospira interrogans serovar Copenhageni str. LT2050]EMM94067.1 hypothetical protein LEP1GSC158_4451 [Leptospira interrogans serovar Zanoni str. LT2156]EMO02559.1 hypothetical protein LEP1GSC116_1255 [Leptospira interrogans serovar Icterohaemorrhagiae str. Verdun HP]EMP09343.1 hypothetical protein LEP1GSC124_3004 [Leptospira interrogans serovar Pyr
MGTSTKTIDIKFVKKRIYKNVKVVVLRVSCGMEFNFSRMKNLTLKQRVIDFSNFLQSLYDMGAVGYVQI